METHKKDIFKGGIKYKVNVLTSVGWRCGKFFNGNDDILWFNPAIDYGDGVDVEKIFAVQIIILH